MVDMYIRPSHSLGFRIINHNHVRGTYVRLVFCVPLPLRDTYDYDDDDGIIHARQQSPSPTLPLTRIGTVR